MRSMAKLVSPGDRFVQQPQHFAHVGGAVSVVVFRPRRKTPASVDRHLQPSLGVVCQHDGVERRGNVSSQGRIVGLGGVRHVMGVSRGLRVFLGRSPVDRRHRQVHDMKAGLSNNVRVNGADRHREHKPIANACVLAVADDGGAIVEEHSKERDRFGRRGRNTGEPRKCGQRHAGSTVHGGLQSNLAYQASQARRRTCLAEAQSAKADVENLLRNSEFPVEFATTKFFFHRIGRESPRSRDRHPPSYFVSLVWTGAVRKITGLLIFRLAQFIHCRAAPS
jgi:hypothetical protein